MIGTQHEHVPNFPCPERLYKKNVVKIFDIFECLLNQNPTNQYS